MAHAFRQRPPVGHVLRRAGIALAATVLGLGWKKLEPWLAKQDLEWILAGGLVAFVITVAALLFLDWVLDRLYASLRWLRRTLAAWEGSFIEGAWLDIALTGSGSSRRALNYSFIQITYEDGEHKVTGQSWQANNGAELQDWSSEFSTWERDTLTFWFPDDKRSRSVASRATFRFDVSRLKTPTRFFGSYIEGDCKVDTRAVRLDQAWLDTFNRRHASSDSHSNVTLEQAMRETVDARDLRCRLARAQLGLVAEDLRLEAPDWTSIERTGFSPYYSDWYAVFLAQTDGKIAERKLVDSFAGTLQKTFALDRSIESIFDIGPGNGELTAVFLRHLVSSPFQKLRYTAIEPSFALGEQLRGKLKEAHKKIEWRLVGQSWREYVNWGDAATYDLALAFHSLYYCEDAPTEIGAVLDRVAAGTFKHGAILFHTDWKSDSVLDALIRAAGTDDEVCDVVGATDYEAKRRNLQPAVDDRGTLAVAFPTLSDPEWDRLQAGGDLAHGDAVQTVAQLLAFLVNKEPATDDRWAAATRTLKESLRSRHALHLPLRIQYFRRPP